MHGRIDLDNFKALNDTQGHDAGDRALQAVSEALRGRLRKGDEIARLGGDEFGLRLGLEHGDPAANQSFRDELERAVDEALHRQGLATAGDKRIGASVGFGADEGAADAAAMARKAERGVSQPRANTLDELPSWVTEDPWADDPQFAGLLSKAKEEGFTGAPEDLWGRYLDEIKSTEGLNEDLAQSMGSDPRRLLKLIAKKGGLADVPELKEHRLPKYTAVHDAEGRPVYLKNGKQKMRLDYEDIGGVKGVFNDRSGLKLDAMAELINADGPEFAHLKDPRALLEAFDEASNELRNGKKAGRGLQPNLGEGWWRRIDDQLDPQVESNLDSSGEAPAEDLDAMLEQRAGEAISNANQGRSATEDGIQPIAESGKLTRRAREEAAGSPRWAGTRGEDLERIINKVRNADSSSPAIEDILDTGEAQPRLPGAGDARQVGQADTTFRAPQQASGDDFSLEHLLGDGAAERIKAEENPALTFDDSAVSTDSGAPADTPASAPEAPVANKPAGPGVPPNVRDFLTRQLKYTPEQVAAMDPAEAVRVGKERIPNPDYQAPQERPVQPSGLVGPDRPNTQLGKVLSAQERRQALLKTRVEPGATPTTAEGAPAPTTVAQKLAAGEKLTEKELKQAGLAAPDIADKARPKLREMGLSPRQLDQRAVRMAKYIENPTADNFERWVQDVAGQAERSNEKDFKAGTGTEGKAPSKHQNGEYLASGPGAMIELAKKLYKSDPAAFRVAMQAGAGSLAGAFTDDEDRLRGGIYGALAGAALTPSGARMFRKQFTRLAGMSGAGKNVGLHDLRAGRDLKKDIGWGEMVFGSPERVVPDVFKKANDTLDELQQLWQEKPKVAGKAEKLYMRDAIADIREAADEAEAAGLKRRAWYANKLADALSKKPTEGQRRIQKFGEMAGLNLTGKELESAIGGNVYRVLTGYGLDTALQNLTQPILALAHVPPKYMLAGYRAMRTAEGKAASAFLELRKPIDAADDVLGDIHLPAKSPEQLKGIEGVIKDPQRYLRKSDSFNRKVVYLGAKEYAKSTGAAESAAHDYAMGVVRKTQGNAGPLGNNPLQRGVAASFVKPFTKYPTMFVEHMIDVFGQPDTTGRNRLVLTMLGLIGASHAAALATGGQSPDLGEMLLSGGRPLGISLTHPMRSLKRIASFDKSPFPVVRAGHDAFMHATGQADHSVLEDAPQAVFGRFPTKAFTELKHFFDSGGTGDHVARTPSGAADPHSALEGLENLLGMRSERQIDQSDLMNDAYDARDRAQADTAATKRQAKKAYLDALDKGDMAEALKQQRILGSSSARTLRKGKDKTRFEKLLANSPKAIRQQLESEFGERAQGDKLP
jgi:diguanylate cyclase (GGDEF)-like protein